MDLVAVATFAHRMVFGKLVPVLFLRRAQNAGAAAKRAGIVERGQKSVADKLRTIRDSLECRHQRLIDFERYNFGFAFTHVQTPLLVNGTIIQSITNMTIKN